MGRMREKAVTLAGAVCVLVAVAGGLSGCSAPGDSVAEGVAGWIADQTWVESAEGAVNEDPWSPSTSFTIHVDPAIPDDDLVSLVIESDKRAADSGVPNRSLLWQVGADQSFSDLGGRATLDVFLGLRHDERFTTVSARGDASCGPIFCVTLTEAAASAATEGGGDSDSDTRSGTGSDSDSDLTPDPVPLLDAVTDMLALADEAGGVQTNLAFDAVTPDGRFRVTAQPDAPVDDAVALWDAIAAQVPLHSATAWVVQPVGDIPPAQLLDITVLDPESQATAETIASTWPTVELRPTLLTG